jgi:hypothetical protein
LVIISKEEYCHNLLPKFAELKLKYFYDANTIFHERDIRKHSGEFDFLTNADIRDNFMNDLTELMETIDYKVVSVIFDKSKLSNPQKLYENATEYVIASVREFLKSKNETGLTTITFESRGKDEDRNLSEFFNNKVECSEYESCFRPAFARKSSNGFGLQFADLIARPIGRHIMNAEQKNRAWDVIETKLCEKDGLIVLPE